MRQHRITRSAALGLALAAIAAPSAAAQQDLRGPDARDAARPAAVRQPHQDMRSPDARDAAEGRGTFNAPEVTVVRLEDSPSKPGGLDWADAGIGAGGMLGLVLLGLGGGLLVTHRRQHVAHRRTAMTG